MLRSFALTHRISSVQHLIFMLIRNHSCFVTVQHSLLASTAGFTIVFLHFFVETNNKLLCAWEHCFPVRGERAYFGFEHNWKIGVIKNKLRTSPKRCVNPWGLEKSWDSKVLRLNPRGCLKWVKDPCFFSRCCQLWLRYIAVPGSRSTVAHTY